jgi:hypothetical protein
MSKKESNPDPVGRIPYAHVVAAGIVRPEGGIRFPDGTEIPIDQISACLKEPDSKCFDSPTYITKDSGERMQFYSGMQRDKQTGKPRYDLCDKGMYKRWAELMGRGADKYGENNWRKANSQEELDRFKASAERHLISWLSGEEDEDHASAVIFNIAAYEATKVKLQNK